MKSVLHILYFDTSEIVQHMLVIPEMTCAATPTPRFHTHWLDTSERTCDRDLALHELDGIEAPQGQRVPRPSLHAGLTAVGPQSDPFDATGMLNHSI